MSRMAIYPICLVTDSVYSCFPGFLLGCPLSLLNKFHTITQLWNVQPISPCYLKHAHIFVPCWLLWWKWQWQPTPVLLPGKFHGPRSLVDCSPWGRYELDTTEQLHFYISLSCIGEGNGNPLQCSCLEVSCCLWCHTGLDTTEAT